MKHKDLVAYFPALPLLSGKKKSDKAIFPRSLYRSLVRTQSKRLVQQMPIYKSLFFTSFNTPIIASSAACSFVSPKPL